MYASRNHGMDDQEEPAEPIVDLDGEDTYEPEAILDVRLRRKKEQYLIKWVGYPPEENSWEPLEHLENAMELGKEFKAQHHRRKELAKEGVEMAKSRKRVKKDE